MKRSDLPTRGTGSRGPCKPGQVYWIEDGDETFLAVVVRAASTGSNGEKNDLMTVYLYPWPDDPPDDLAAIDPISRALIYTLWKVSRRQDGWTKLGDVPDFDLADWPLEPMRHPAGAMVIPHPEFPGEIVEQRPAADEDLEGLQRYGFGTGFTMIRTYRDVVARRSDSPREQ